MDDTTTATAKPLRVAQVIGKMHAGGVESVLFNYYRFIDKSQIQFDFYYDADSSVEPPQKLIDMGARFVSIPPYQKPFAHIAALKKHFRNEAYKIVHVHLNTLSVIPLYAAWRVHIPVRILHNHSTAGRGEMLRNMLKYILRPLCPVFATDYCACSMHAAEWMYGKKKAHNGSVKIWNNAIDTKRFAYNEQTRKEVRNELGLAGRFVVGHVGRFMVTKNHKFLLEIFHEVHKQQPNAVLMLVGDGPLMGAVKEQVHRLGLDDCVLFLGVRQDVDRLYQGMDVFVFPSLYEGLGMAAVEAQAACLPVFTSTKVPDTAICSSLGHRLELSKNRDFWSQTIMRHMMKERCTITISSDLDSFDIRKSINLMQSYYTSINRRCNYNLNITC